VTGSKFHIQDPQIFGDTVQNLVATATCSPVLVHPCISDVSSVEFCYHRLTSLASWLVG